MSDDLLFDFNGEMTRAKMEEILDSFHSFHDYYINTVLIDHQKQTIVMDLALGEGRIKMEFIEVRHYQLSTLCWYEEKDYRIQAFRTAPQRCPDASVLITIDPINTFYSWRLYCRQLICRGNFVW